MNIVWLVYFIISIDRINNTRSPLSNWPCKQLLNLHLASNLYLITSDLLYGQVIIILRSIPVLLIHRKNLF